MIFSDFIYKRWNTFVKIVEHSSITGLVRFELDWIRFSICSIRDPLTTAERERMIVVLLRKCFCFCQKIEWKTFIFCPTKLISWRKTLWIHHYGSDLLLLLLMLMMMKIWFKKENKRWKMSIGNNYYLPLILEYGKKTDAL